MKYKNANTVLPKELIEQIQKYVQGEYLYIPINDQHRMESVTDYKIELVKRDAHIYTKYLEGMSQKRLSQMYHLSESSIRRIVMKQRNQYQLTGTKIGKVLFHWGLENDKVKQIYDTVWQVGDRYVLKVYQDSEMLERNLNVLNILENMNIPVGGTIAAIDGKQYVTEDGAFYLLSKKLTGSNLVRICNIKELALQMGEIIANLHTAFKKCEDTSVFWNNHLLDEMNGWVKQNFEESNWNYIDKESYENIVSKLTEVSGELPVQLIHRDIHFGNFLFDHGVFSGYIDFDLSQKNIRIFDICYFLLGLLVEKEKFGLTEEQWFEFIKYVFIGYESKLELSEIEKKSVPCVMECIELLFVSYFNSIDDRACAESAYGIFKFVENQEHRIWKSIK